MTDNQGQAIQNQISVERAKHAATQAIYEDAIGAKQAETISWCEAQMCASVGALAALKERLEALTSKNSFNPATWLST